MLPSERRDTPQALGLEAKSLRVIYISKGLERELELTLDAGAWVDPGTEMRALVDLWKQRMPQTGQGKRHWSSQVEVQEALWR